MNQELSPELTRLMEAMENRDANDVITGSELQGEMLEDGFYPFETGEVLEIDTGKNGGIQDTLATIIAHLTKIQNCRLITIEGLSGTGKSTAASLLAEQIGGCCVSTGEIFRYLATQRLLEPLKQPESILRGLQIIPVPGKAQLWKKGVNLSEKYAKEFRRPDVEKMSSILGGTCQLPVINFLRREVQRLRETSGMVLIMEGRSYNLTYFPADLRVKLKADLLIRAQKRLNQWD